MGRVITTVEQIEQMIGQLPPEDFEKLSTWIEQQRRAHWTRSAAPERTPAPLVMRDHQAFLNSYAPEDEGLYDDAASR